MLDYVPNIGSVFRAVLDPVLANFKYDSVASSLAASIIAAGVLLLAVFLARVVQRLLQIHGATRLVLSTDDNAGFLREFERISESMGKLGPVGRAWASFKPTLVFPSRNDEQRAEVRGTVAPSAYFHIAGVGAQWTVFKALPNIFVGIGLLLTFLGLVAALTFTTRAIEGAATPDQTQQALKDLLHATSFKFFTSVAGLLVSLVFTIGLKIAAKLLESRLAGLCRAIEARVHLVTLEEIALEHLNEARQQTADIKLFNDEVAIQVGRHVEQALSVALPTAMSPIAQALERVTEKISASSQSAVGDMVADFSRQLQGNVGQNMLGLAETLGELRTTLTTVNSRMAETGHGLSDQFGSSIAELRHAALEMASAMRDAGERSADGLNDSSVRLEGQLKRTVAELEATTQRMSVAVEQMAGRLSAGSDVAASNFSRHLDEAARGFVSASDRSGKRIEDAIAGIGRSTEAAGAQVAKELADVGSSIAQQARAASEAAERRIRESSGELAGVVADIGGNLSGTVTTLTQALMAVSEQMRGVEARMAAHRDALDGAARSTREAGSAFAASAVEFRAASSPIVDTGRMMGQATSTVQKSIEALQGVMASGRDDARRIQEQLQATISASEQAWRSYEQRFGQVDEALGKSLERIVGQTKESLSLLESYVEKLSGHIGKGMDHLGGGIEDLGEHVAELKRAVGGWR